MPFSRWSFSSGDRGRQGLAVVWCQGHSVHRYPWHGTGRHPTAVSQDNNTVIAGSFLFKETSMTKLCTCMCCYAKEQTHTCICHSQNYYGHRDAKLNTFIWKCCISLGNSEKVKDLFILTCKASKMIQSSLGRRKKK